MHKLRCQRASPDLQPFVRTYAQREVLALPAVVNEPCPARLEQTLEFQFGELFDVVSGNQHRDRARLVTIVGAYVEGGLSVVLRKNIISFAIFFQPTGLSRLLQIPAAEFSNKAFDGLDLLGRDIHRLHEQLAACISFTSRVAITEDFLRARAARVPLVERDICHTSAAAMFTANGLVRVASTAAECGLSVRQFERRFLERIGISPKVYARVARFQTALDAKLITPARPWLDIAHDLGYHDQMHMVRDFHELAGAAPGQILKAIRDARPPAMRDFSQFS